MGWLLLLLLYFPSYTCSFSLCNHHDSFALLQFKSSFVLNPLLDDSWHPSNPCSDFPSNTESWKDGTNCCQWDGVTCDPMSGHVIGLDLSCSNLEGEFHPNSTLFTLSHLQKLNLAFNNFSGSSIQSGIGDLVNLLHLDLSHSGFSGDIPSTISHLSKLVSLHLSNYNWRIRQFGPSYPRMRLDPYTWKNLIQNASNLREINLDNVDMSSTQESSLSLLTNLSTSLVSLSLADTQLQGNNMPTHILCFPNLQILILDDNINLGGELPKSNWSTHLRSLSLPNCSFDGMLPSSLFNLTQLSHLDLSANKLVGRIPRWCYSLPSLIYLDLSDNHFKGSIGEFSTYSLEYLSLSNNRLHGNFPNSIFELQNLSYFSLSSTDLSGHVDFHRFSKFLSLFYLDLSHNLFTGSISNFSYRSLFFLDLSNNKLHGSILQWFHEKHLHSWENIEFVDLSFNKLQGDLAIPPNGIEYFSVSNNEFTGDIPSTMCNASSLTMLNLAHNNLIGMIPQCLGTFPSLWVLDLQKNNLRGSIPQNFSKRNAFETIKLNGNQLEGPLPKSLSHCTTLQVLDLGNNKITDTFPHWLETLQQLQVFSIRSNQFHGVITYIGTNHPFPMLRIFDVSNNNFSGPLPASCIRNFQGMMNVNDGQTGLKYVGNHYSYNDSVVVVMKGLGMELVRILTTFTTIDLSNNMFEGEIPKVIGELHSLKGLNLSHNRITGTIPQSLANLRNLESLDLSWNQLRGKIPGALTNLNFLEVLNLSQNHFEGTIPIGNQFSTFGNDSYVGNPMLCGLPLSKSCNADEERKTHSTFDNAESGFCWKGVAVGYACGVIFGTLLGCNVFMTGKPQWLARLVEGVLNEGVKRSNNRARANHRGRN